MFQSIDGHLHSSGPEMRQNIIAKVCDREKQLGTRYQKAEGAGGGVERVFCSTRTKLYIPKTHTQGPISSSHTYLLTVTVQLIPINGLTH